MIYPGSVPEFRILIKDNIEVLQVRYIASQVGYIGKWQDVPTIIENEQHTTITNA